MRGGRWFLALAMLALLPLCAHALAVSYEYLDGNVLPLPPGATYYFKLVVQNEESVPTNATLTVDSPAATIIGEPNMYLPARSFDTVRYLQITVPADAPDGAEIPVRYTLSPVATQPQDGQVPFGVRYDRGIAVKVVSGSLIQKQEDPIPTPPRSPNDRIAPEPSAIDEHRLWAMLAAIVIALLIAFLLWRVARGGTKQEPHRR